MSLKWSGFSPFHAYTACANAHEAGLQGSIFVCYIMPPTPGSFGNVIPRCCAMANQISPCFAMGNYIGPYTRVLKFMVDETFSSLTVEISSVRYKLASLIYCMGICTWKWWRKTRCIQPKLSSFTPNCVPNCKMYSDPPFFRFFPFFLFGLSLKQRNRRLPIKGLRSHSVIHSYFMVSPDSFYSSFRPAQWRRKWRRYHHLAQVFGYRPQMVGKQRPNAKPHPGNHARRPTSPSDRGGQVTHYRARHGEA